MSVTTSNFQYQTTNWHEKTAADRLVVTNHEVDSSSMVDDGLTSLSWLQNLNMCMTRLGAPTPPTPPASPVCTVPSSQQVLGIRKVASSQSPPATCNNKSDAIILDLANGPVSRPLSATDQRISSVAVKPSSNELTITPPPFSPKPETPIKKKCSSQSKFNSKQSKKSLQPTVCNENNSQPAQYQDVVDYKSNGSIKPPFSYATLICMAMKANKNKMTLSSIYKWIKENFLYYRNADPSWQNSIRHNLSLNKCFIKIPRNKDEPGKGGFWKLDPIYADSLVDGVFKKRRPSQKTSQGASMNVGTREKTSKKKSRKKNHSRAANSVYIDTKIKPTQETPPSSAESYSYKEIGDRSELVNAVSSIENGCAAHYTYTALNATNLVDCDQASLVHDYTTEVCIPNSTNGECIIESDGNDICWNTILTDADLNELVDSTIHYTDSVGQIIDPLESDMSHTGESHSKSNTGNATTQLTAVEPHELDMIASGSSMLEGQQLFYSANQLHEIAFDANTANVISATANVVTCINDANMVGHWNQWTGYQPNNASIPIECATHNAELILSQIEQGSHEQLTMSEVSSTASSMPYIVSTNPLHAVSSPMPMSVAKHTARPILATMGSESAISLSIDTTSQSPTNYDVTPNGSTLQSMWPECKASLETGSLDLDTFATMESMSHF